MKNKTKYITDKNVIDLFESLKKLKAPKSNTIFNNIILNKFSNIDAFNSWYLTKQHKDRRIPAGIIASKTTWEDLSFSIKDNQKPFILYHKDKKQKKEYVYSYYQLKNKKRNILNKYLIESNYKIEDKKLNYQKLKKIVESYGIRVNPNGFHELSGRTEGYTIMDDRSIYLSPFCINNFATLLHELFHNLYHHVQQNKYYKLKELEAEASAYLVLQHLNANSRLLKISLRYIKLHYDRIKMNLNNELFYNLLSGSEKRICKTVNEVLMKLVCN